MSSATRLSANGTDPEVWRNTLRRAAKEVLSVMVGLHATDPEGEEPGVLSDFTAMVGLAGALCGIVTVRCGANSGSRIAAKMLGVEASNASEQSDAVGEICNMVAGNFKANVPGMEDQCMLSVPTVIQGSEYEVHSLAVGKRIDEALILEGEPFWVSLEIRN